MFMELTSSSENRFTSPSCSEMSSAQLPPYALSLGPPDPEGERPTSLGSPAGMGAVTGKGGGVPVMDGVWLGRPLPGKGRRSSKKQVALAGSEVGGMRGRGTDGLAPSLPWEAWRFGQQLMSL